MTSRRRKGWDRFLKEMMYLPKGVTEVYFDMQDALDSGNWKDEEDGDLLLDFKLRAMVWVMYA
jgi:hypothetical protein